MSAGDFCRHVLPTIAAAAYLLVVAVARHRLIRQSGQTLTAYIERLRTAYPSSERIERPLGDALKLAKKNSEDLVLQGWRLAHGVEPLLACELPAEQIVARLVVVGHELSKSPVEGRAELGRRMLEAVRPVPGRGPRATEATLRALLAEGLAQTYDARDDYFDGVVQENRRSTWLTALGLAGVAGLAAAFGRSAFFLMGAIGGLFSRLTRILRRRPEPTDYGVSWGPLILGPVAGALAGWIGILVLAALGEAGVSPLSERLTPNWDQAAASRELTLAFLLGFSERFLQRILTSSLERTAPPPEAQPVATGGIPRETGPTRRQ